MALALSAMLLLASCGTSSPPSAPVAAVAASSASVSPGVTQFTAPGQGAVLWGLSEQGYNAVQPAPTYPLAVSQDGRYLVDQSARPWRVQADAAWLMSSQATDAEVDQYLSDRRAQGFNSFYLMAMVHPGGYSAAPNAPNDRDGDPPFATPGDFSTAGASPASERYWQWIDTIVAKAAQHGMVVMLAYTYLGSEGGNQGWYQDVVNQRSTQVLFDWGQWLGNRYRNSPNVIWFGLGDYTPPAGSDGAARVKAIADGIKAVGATQPFMGEPSEPDGLPAAVPGIGSLLDMNSFYGYGPSGQGEVYVTADSAYRFTPTKPAWMQEGTYELEDNSGSFSGQPWDTRRGRFWSVLGGGTAGDGFGSRDAWQWKNIPTSLHTAGATYSSAAFDLFASMPWWTLQPSGTDPGFAGANLITSGGGTSGKADYITSALTQDHHWLLAYVPVSQTGARTFTVDTSVLDGSARARWFDPASGMYIAIDDGQLHPLPATRSFTTPGKRADNTDDWVLVIDTEPDVCGAITSTGLYTAPAVAPPAGITCTVTAVRHSDLAVAASSPAQTK
jgi:hypothetical protein